MSKFRNLENRILRSVEEIEELTDQFNGFIDARLSYEFDLITKLLKIDIEYGEKGLAGTEYMSTSACFVLVNADVTSGTLVQAESNLKLYHIMSLEVGIGLIFDIWGKEELVIKCDSIKVVSVKQSKQIVQPALSEFSVFFKIKINYKPDINYWIRELSYQVSDVVCVGYFGEEVPVDQIVDCSGISLRRKIDKGFLGVKICKYIHSNGVLEILISRQDRLDIKFWNAFIDVLTKMEVLEVLCGNVKFNANEWSRYVSAGA